MDSKIAIWNTLSYSDIFDYPLTFEEVYRFLITDTPISKADIKKTLSALPNITKKGDYYAIASREHIIARREEKKHYNEKKIKRIQHIVKKLSVIPTVLFIGVSGGVAMHNADKNDDIDLFVITKKNTIWTSRFLLVVLLTFFGILRTRTTKQLADTVCLNMLIDETKIAFSKDRQDLYTAHEIVQMMPLLERKNTYKKFLQANNWYTKYMPNSTPVEKVFYVKQESGIEKFGLFLLTLPFIEWMCRGIQKAYMESHVTKETISSTLLAFHPRNYREETLKKYQRKINKYV